MLLLIDIKSNDWMKYLRRKDNLIIAIFLGYILWNYFPSCHITYMLGSEVESFFYLYNDRCYGKIAFIDKVNIATHVNLIGSYRFIVPTLLSTLSPLITFFIAKYLFEIRIQNRRKRLK